MCLCRTCLSTVPGLWPSQLTWAYSTKPAAWLTEPTRELELVMKLIKDKWLTFIIILFIIILLSLQDLSFLKWLQGLNGQLLANTGTWLRMLLPPRPTRAQCKPPASSNLTHGASLCPRSPRASLLLSPGRVSSRYPASTWKPTPIPGSSRKPHHSGGTTTNSNLWKQRRCSITAQDGVTVGATQEPLKTGEKNQPTNQKCF